MKALYSALIKFQHSLRPVAKNKENPHYHSKFADLTALWDAVREQLSVNELCVTQYFDTSAEGDQCLVTRLAHSSGEYLDSRLKMLLTKQDAQGLGSATTYYRRYALSAILGLTTEEDDDGTAASEERNPPAAWVTAVLDPKVEVVHPRLQARGITELPPASSANEEAILNIGKQLIGFGKYAKQTINSLKSHEGRSYVQFLRDSAAKKNQTPMGAARTFIQNWEIYDAYMTNKQKQIYDESQPPDDLPPF